MNALTLKGFLSIATFASLISGIGICSYCALDGQLDLDAVALIGIGSVEIGLMVAGCCYLVQLVKDMRTIRLASEDMLPSEKVIMERFGCHFRRGRPLKFWEAVGGKLILTTHRLAFLAHRGQPWHYRLSIPLERIAKADACELFWGIPGCFRLTTIGGKQELFNFGAIHADLESERWVAAIIQARYRANPEWGAEN